MNAGSVITIIILGVILVIVVSLTIYMTIQNKKKQMVNQVMPFTARLDPSGNLTPSLTTASGASQISCPVGTKINILGSILEVYDPYSECLATGAVPEFQTMCSNYNTQPNPDPTSTTGQLCANTDPSHGYRNTTCWADGSGNYGDGNCKIRNASIYLAGACDGKTGACNVTVDNSTVGPWPCQILPAPVGSGSDYLDLPIANGNSGLPTAPSPVQSTMAQGYYLHGLAVCIPNDE
jgi:hypothetical protein